MRSRLIALAVAARLIVAAATGPAAAVRYKLDVIESGKARPGAVFTFTQDELNAFARSTLITVVPEGVRQPHVEIGAGTATGTAIVDFLKIRHAQGEQTPWLIAKLIEGEKYVKVSAGIQSAHGKATVYLQRVEISGLVVSGPTLDFLIRNFFMPLYPDAKINQPFDLADRIDRLEAAPGIARAYIRK